MATATTKSILNPYYHRRSEAQSRLKFFVFYFECEHTACDCGSVFVFFTDILFIRLTNQPLHIQFRIPGATALAFLLNQLLCIGLQLFYFIRTRFIQMHAIISLADTHNTTHMWPEHRKNYNQLFERVAAPGIHYMIYSITRQQSSSCNGRWTDLVRAYLIDLIIAGGIVEDHHHHHCTITMEAYSTRMTSFGAYR